MKYTDAQIKAINQGRNPAIVSAGAGSGKTAVLTQRVVRLICDKNENIDPSKIVVVTFTEKAANELKARLDALMRQRISEAVNSADVRFLRNQRMKLYHKLVLLFTAQGKCRPCYRHFGRLFVDRRNQKHGAERRYTVGCA